MDKNKEFIREIKINKKKRFKYNVVTLIFLNFLLLLSLIYMCSLLRNWFIGIVGFAMFVGCLIGSAKTILNSKENRKYVIYRDKITIQSSTLNAEIPLEKVFMVKKRRGIFEYIFKRDAHTVLVSIKNPHNQFYMLPFIDEDVNFLVDEIMELAISARMLNKAMETNENKINKATDNVKSKKQSKKRTKKQTILEQVENILTEDNSNLVLKTAENKERNQTTENSKSNETQIENLKTNVDTQKEKAIKNSKNKKS